MISHLRERILFAWFCTVHRRSLVAQRRWQTKHLQRLVQYAYAHVPIWKVLLDEKGVDATSIVTLEDLALLPITNKRTFIGKMVEDYIDNSRATLSYWYVTSGTSGIPFRFLMSERAILEKYIDFASFRFLWWRGESLKHLSSIKLARIKIRGPSSKNRLFIPVETLLKNPLQTLQQLKDFGAEILSAYPAILLEIANFIEKNPGTPRPRLRFVLSFGEMLSQSTREYVSRILECEIYNRYGLEEIGVIGVECAMHNGFHINTESVIIEILDESHRPVLPGTEGRIVATDLFNFGMPFIRYDTGDSGYVCNEQCACGLQSPRLWIKGRYSAFLTFPTRKIHHLEFDGAMDGFMNYVSHYQIVKKSDAEVVVRIVAGPFFSPRAGADVQKSLENLVGTTIAVRVEVVESLPLSPRGKCLIVSDESQNDRLSDSMSAPVA